MNLIVIGDSSQGHEIAKRALEIEVTHKTELGFEYVESTCLDTPFTENGCNVDVIRGLGNLDVFSKAIDINTKPDWIKDGNVNIGKRKAKKRR